jgi:adenylate cyclase
MDYELGPFRLDAPNAVLLHGSEPLALGRRAVALLQALIEKPGALVSKDVLIEAAWPGQAVEDSNLAVQIAALRRALAKAPGGDRWIETMPRRGYRFVGPVVAKEASSVPAAPLQVAAPPDAQPIGHDEAECRQITAPSGDLVGGGAGDNGAGPEDLHQAVGAFQPSVSEIAGRHSRRGRVIVGLAIAVTLAFVCLLWWPWPASNFFSRAGKPGEQEKGSMPAIAAPTTAAVSPPLVAPPLSIVVLPFTNLSRDPGEQYFVDGITEDLTTDLSRLSDMLVISSNTAFTYRGKWVDTKQIRRELGVRYVLEGSIERSGSEIRANAQLIDAATDTHLWAERFDGDTSDLFALQDEITGRIANTLYLKLTAVEAARPTDHPDALDYIFKGRAALGQPTSKESFAAAIGFFEQALALNPRSVEARSRLAQTLIGRGLDGFSDSQAGDLARADALIVQALAAQPSSLIAHFAKGLLLRARGRPDEAAFEFEDDLASDRNWVGALFQLGWCKWMTGSIDEVIPLAERVIRLDPRDPNIANFYWRIGSVHLLQSHFRDAVLWLERARSANPRIAGIHGALVSAYALEGETERATAELAEARRLAPDKFASLASLRAAGSAGARNYWGAPKIHAMFEATYFAGLRKAGMPEE